MSFDIFPKILNNHFSKLQSKDSRHGSITSAVAQYHRHSLATFLEHNPLLGELYLAVKIDVQEESGTA